MRCMAIVQEQDNFMFNAKIRRNPADSCSACTESSKQGFGKSESCKIPGHKRVHQGHGIQWEYCLTYTENGGHI